MSNTETAPSAETEFKSARPDIETVEAGVDVPTTNQLEVMVNSGEASTEQASANDPTSRITKIINGSANVAHRTGDFLQNAADRYEAGRQDRQEKREAFVDNAKDVMRGFGRGALRVPGLARRGYLETRAQVEVAAENAAAFGQNVAGKAAEGITTASGKVAEGIGTAAGAVIETGLNARDAVAKGANVVRDTVVDAAGEVKTAATETFESLKAGAEQTLREIDAAVTRGMDTATKMADQLAEGIELKAAEWKAKAGAEYTAARDAVGNLMNEKMNQLTGYFAARKEAALARKQARVDARDARLQARAEARAEKLQNRADTRDARAAERAKTAEINDRVVNVRKMEIRDQQEARRANSAEAREARRKEAEQKAETRRRGRAALGTAIRSGIYTAKETYNTLK